MTPGPSSLETIQKKFIERFHHFEIRLPEENIRERRRGSLPYGTGGRIFYIFGEEAGVEYVEFFAYHRMGQDHSQYYEDGRVVHLPDLDSGYCVDPEIPGDREQKGAEMKKRYQETLNDLVRKGLFSEEPVPGSLAVNSYLALYSDESGEPHSE
jgi:hypothetical protein